MSATRSLVRMKLVQIEALLTALGGAGSGIGPQASSLGQRLPPPLLADMKQVNYIGQRVMQGGHELDAVDTQRFVRLTERVVAALGQLQTPGAAAFATRAPSRPAPPAWTSFTENVLHHYADFSGRVRRREYWLFALINGVISVVIGFAEVLLSGVSMDDFGTGLVSVVYGLATFLPSLALTVRRLHDMGKSGQWVLIMLLPFVGFIVLLVLLTTDSESRLNKWGPNPKGVGEARFAL